jgi:hypothetical protein
MMTVYAADGREAVGDDERRSFIMICMSWERPVQHSIRPDFKDGFLLPYHQILQLLAQNPSLDVEKYVVRVVDDHWGQFSYASEHVSHDGAIAALLACQRALLDI